MNNKNYDVLAVGNAIVDVLSQESDQFLTEHNLTKGSMALIDQERTNQLYSKMQQTVEQSGGSAGNTVAGISSFGGCCAYIGKVADDPFGHVFKRDMQAIGVDHLNALSDEKSPTASCLIVVTPDGQRTMSTHLGISSQLSVHDLYETEIAQAKLVYLEGYLFDKPSAKQAFKKATEIAHQAGNKVALTLSDGFCVDRHRDEFRELIRSNIDILFANEDEIKSLYQTQDLQEAIEQVKAECEIIAITLGEKGSIILWNNEIYNIAAKKTDQVVDTTGAGDLYAAGFLYGYTQGMSLKECGELGSIAASEVISHMGGRPAQKLSDLIAA